MGVGRNLAYKRSLFFSVKGFASHQHLLSGDDDLFVNETATAQNVSVCIEPEAKTISKPHEKWSHWIYQKRRHYSTGKLYKPAHKFMLGLYSISLFMFYVTFVLSLVLFPTYWLPILGIFILRFIVQAIVLLKNMQILGYKPYFFGYPLFDFGILFIQIFIGIRGYFSKPLRWNS